MKKGTSYEHLVDRYIEFVLRSYPHATVVFDGYSQGASTKDMAHAQRRNIPGRDVHFDPLMHLSEKKEDFLSNVQNKQKFIQLVGERMEKAGISVVHAEGDADCVIAREALLSASEHATHVVGEDTDLLVLLLFHVKSNMKNVYFSSSKTTVTRAWDIKKTQADVGLNVCKHILFAHAFSGCDTTSRPFGVGKTATLKNIKEGNPAFLKGADVFLSSSSDQKLLTQTGERLLVSLYKGKDTDTLDHLRLLRYHDKMSTGTKQIQPKNLPPTSAAATQHCLRVYYQVQEWACLGANFSLNPRHWGFQEQQGKLHPVPSDLPPAPDELLNIIKCGCTTDCSSKGRCSCKSFGLSCTTTCTGCRGVSCLNSMLPLHEEDVGAQK